MSAWVTMPTGFVKSMIHASGFARSRVTSASCRATGMVRSALAKPPAPVVSWPMVPNRRGSVSSTRRAAWPPIRSCTSTKLGVLRRGVQVVGQPQPSGPLRLVQHPLREPADHSQPIRVDVVEGQLVDVQARGAIQQALDELGGVGAAAADDGDLDGHALVPCNGSGVGA